MARHDDRDAELRAGPADQRQHLVAPRRIQAVGGLIEQEQPGVVDQRLGELDPLAHARGVATHGPIALLVEPHVPEDLRGPLASGPTGQPGHRRHVGHEIGGRHVRWQAVVFGHVADELADLDALSDHVEVHDRRRPGRGRQQAEEDLEEGALAGAVRPDETDDARLEVEGQAVKGDDTAGITFGEGVERDEGHGP